MITIYYIATLPIEDINMDLDNKTIEPMVLPLNLGTHLLTGILSNN